MQSTTTTAGRSDDAVTVLTLSQTGHDHDHHSSMNSSRSSGSSPLGSHRDEFSGSAAEPIAVESLPGSRHLTLPHALELSTATPPTSRDTSHAPSNSSHGLMRLSSDTFSMTTTYVTMYNTTPEDHSSGTLNSSWASHAPKDDQGTVQAVHEGGTCAAVLSAPAPAENERSVRTPNLCAPDKSEVMQPLFAPRGGSNGLTEGHGSGNGLRGSHTIPSDSSTFARTRRTVLPMSHLQLVSRASSSSSPPRMRERCVSFLHDNALPLAALFVERPVSSESYNGGNVHREDCEGTRAGCTCGSSEAVCPGQTAVVRKSSLRAANTTTSAASVSQPGCACVPHKSVSFHLPQHSHTLSEANGPHGGPAMPRSLTLSACAPPAVSAEAASAPHPALQAPSEAAPPQSDWSQPRWSLLSQPPHHLPPRRRSSSASEHSTGTTSLMHTHLSLADPHRYSCAMRFPSYGSRSLSTASIPFAPVIPHTTTLRRWRDAVSRKCYINQYRIIKELGRGECGKVKLAYDEVERRLVAIKQVRRADTKARVGGLSPAQQRYMAFLREVGIMQNLRHTNIASVYEVIDDPAAPKVYLVMQYIENGPIAVIDVRDGTDEVCRPIPAAELARMARQILTGLEYLHQRNIIHRDIKPANILVGADRQVYLVDFGVAETFDTTYRARMERRMAHSMACSMALSEAGEPAEGPVVLGAKGTLLFIAPEVWTQGRSYGKPVDMWAVGVTLYTLLTGRLPFRNPQEINDPALPAIPTSYGTRWSRLLRGMFERDPAKRLTAHQARLFVKEMEQHASPPERQLASWRRSSTVASGSAPTEAGTTATTTRSAAVGATTNASGRSCGKKSCGESASPLLSLVDMETTHSTRMDWKLENVPVDSMWSLQSRLSSQRSLSGQSGRREESKNVVVVAAANAVRAAAAAAAAAASATASASAVIHASSSSTAAHKSSSGSSNSATASTNAHVNTASGSSVMALDDQSSVSLSTSEESGSNVGGEDAVGWDEGPVGVTTATATATPATNSSGSTTSTNNAAEDEVLANTARIIAQMPPDQLPRMSSLVEEDAMPQGSLINVAAAAPAGAVLALSHASQAAAAAEQPLAALNATQPPPATAAEAASAEEAGREPENKAPAALLAPASSEDVLLPSAVVNLLQLHSQSCVRYGSPDNVPFASSSTTSHVYSLGPNARAGSPFALASITRASEAQGHLSAATLRDPQPQPSRSRNPSYEYSILNPSSMMSTAPQSIISPRSNKAGAGLGISLSGVVAARKPSDSRSSQFDELYQLPCPSFRRGSAAQDGTQRASQMTGEAEAEHMSCTRTLAFNATAQGRRTATEKGVQGLGSLSAGMCDEPFEFVYAYRDRTGSNETENNRDLATNPCSIPSLNTASRRNGLTNSPRDALQYMWPTSPHSITRGST